MDTHHSYIEHLLAKSGPSDQDYSELDKWIFRVHNEVASGLISQPELARLRDAFGDALSMETMQGLGLRKPRGYAGDFEMIDRIYQTHVSAAPRLAAWDRYFQQHSAPKAVRNRKAYFHQVLDSHYAERRPLRVLNIASGPGRCMYEWLTANPTAEIRFDCLEIDPTAIDYAMKLNEAFLDRVKFTQMNVLRFRPTEKYGLIWAAGIFDYFNDDVFQSLLGRLFRSVDSGGELIIGNFSERNPSRPYMELLGDWNLHHRTAESLTSLALGCGIDPESIHIGAEPEGVNLFLHIRR